MGALSRLGAVTQDGRGETVQGIVIARRGANARWPGPSQSHLARCRVSTHWP
jgi:hypothetical protein